jgi:hypothetical protein
MRLDLKEGANRRIVSGVNSEANPVERQHALICLRRSVAVGAICALQILVTGACSRPAATEKGGPSNPNASGVAAAHPSATGATGRAGDASIAPTSEPPAKQTVKLYERSPAILRRSLVTDGKDLFWGESSDQAGLLIRAATLAGGGDVRTLGRWYDYPSAQSIALGPAHVHWLRDDGGGSVVTVPKAGGTEQLTLIPVPKEGGALPWGPLVYAEERVWVATRGCSHIARINPGTGESTLFELGPEDDVGSGTTLAIREGKAYCGNGPSIDALTVADGSVETVVEGQEYVGALLWADGSLYFINNRAVAGQNERLMRWQPGEAKATDVGAAFSVTPELLYDAARNTIFWENGYSYSIGALARYVIGSTAPELLLEKQEVMGGLTQDADHLYWLADHDIYRLAKPGPATP